METNHYQKVANIIGLISESPFQHYSLKELADKAHMSEFHFQRLFSSWAGISPKRFLDFIRLHRSKELIKHQSLLAVANNMNLSSSSRLHDLYLRIESMTPNQYRKEGYGVKIGYGFYQTVFGLSILAFTKIGICHLGFGEHDDMLLNDLKKRWPLSSISESQVEAEKFAFKIFDQSNDGSLVLHLKGSPFQIKVWEALLNISEGNISTYAQISKTINKPTAVRAVGNAIGQNPVAYLIPCHRVIRSTGIIGQYRWGTERKTAMLVTEIDPYHFTNHQN